MVQAKSAVNDAKQRLGRDLRTGSQGAGWDDIGPLLWIQCSFAKGIARRAIDVPARVLFSHAPSATGTGV